LLLSKFTVHTLICNLFLQAIKNRFGIVDETDFQIEYYDTDWQSYVDVEDYKQIAHKTKLRCNVLSTVQSVSTTQNLSTSQAAAEKQSTHDKHSVAHSRWPIKFDFPAEKLPSQVREALENQVNLCHPKHRYLRGLLLHTLCDEAVKFTSHPDHSQKVDMARSIILHWPYLTEQIGRGFDGWLASIVDCLKCTRRNLGIIDKTRSAAVLNRKRATTTSELSIPKHPCSRAQGCPVTEGRAGSSEDEGTASGTGDLSSCVQARGSIVARPGATCAVDEGEISGNDGNGNSSQDRDAAVAPPATSGLVLEVGDISAPCVAGHSKQVGDHVTDGPRDISAVGNGEFNGDGGCSSCESAVGESRETDIIEEMKILWRKPEAHCNPRILQLLAHTFDCRRTWIYSCCTKTAELKDMYPALFCMKAVMQEFALISKEKKWMQLAVERALVKTPKFIQLARIQVRILGTSKKMSVKQRRLHEILRKLDLALDETQDEELATKHRAVAGLLLLPHLLGDSACYLYNICEVWFDIQ